MGMKMAAVAWAAPLMLAATPAAAANWGLLGEYRTDGQSVFVDTDSVTGADKTPRSAEIMAIFARDVGRDAAYRLVIDIDCAANKLRARDARTLDAAGRELARDATIGAWGDPAELAFGARLVNYLCAGKDAPAPLLGAAPPIAAARRHLADPDASW